MFLRHRGLLLLIALTLWGVAPWAAAAPRVVATIAPVHSLAAAVMEGVAEPELLIRGAASPHDFFLRPSARRLLESAQLVLWVGEGLESFLPRVLHQLGGGTRIVELSEVAGVERLATREGGVWGAHDHGDEHHETGYHFNPHLWLDPRNAQRWVEAMVEILETIDPANGVRYRDNGRQLVDRLAALDAELDDALRTVREKPYVVFHDAYANFEKRYGLSPAGSISVGDGRAPGARRLSEMRELLRARGAYCLFSEPQFEPRVAAMLVAGTKVKTGELDPIGARLSPGPELYFELLRALARNLVDCLSS